LSRCRSGRNQERADGENETDERPGMTATCGKTTHGASASAVDLQEASDACAEGIPARTFRLRRKSTAREDQKLVIVKKRGPPVPSVPSPSSPRYTV
jgi:hypothetical protein